MEGPELVEKILHQHGERNLEGMRTVSHWYRVFCLLEEKLYKARKAKLEVAARVLLLVETVICQLSQEEE